MSTLGTTRGVLEIAKFALFVVVPVGVLYTIANHNKNLTHKRSYVVHQSKDRHPSTPEEIQQMIRHRSGRAEQE